MIPSDTSMTHNQPERVATAISRHDECRPPHGRGAPWLAARREPLRPIRLLIGIARAVAATSVLANRVFGVIEALVFHDRSIYEGRH